METVNSLQAAFKQNISLKTWSNYYFWRLNLSFFKFNAQKLIYEGLDPWMHYLNNILSDLMLNYIEKRETLDYITKDL